MVASYDHNIIYQLLIWNSILPEDAIFPRVYPLRIEREEGRLTLRNFGRHKTRVLPHKRNVLVEKAHVTQRVCEKRGLAEA
jgi:hypothetical protein